MISLFEQIAAATKPTNPTNMNTIDERDYEIQLANHNNWCDSKLRDMETILALVLRYGIDDARKIFTETVEEMRSMDAPNKPGYYRANND